MNIGKIPRPGYRPPAVRPQHPGALLRGYVDECRIPKSIVARHLGISRMTLLDLLWGKVPVTPELALRINAFMSTPRSVWLNKKAGQKGQPGQPSKYNRAASE